MSAGEGAAPTRFRAPEGEGLLDGELERELRAGIVARLEALLEGREGDVVKENNVRTVLRLELPELEKTAYFKAYSLPRLADRLKAWLFGSRAAHEWRVMRACVARGIPTARPLVVGERRRGRRVEGSFFASEGIPDAVDWIGHLERLRETGRAGERQRALETLGARVRQMHDRGIHHRDLHTNNILVRSGGSSQPDIRFIDLHSGRVVRCGPRRRLAGLTKLAHSLRSATSRTDRARLVRGYLGAGTLRAMTFRRMVARIESGMTRLERRRLESRTRRCVVASSAFRVEGGGNETVYRRAEFPRATLFEAIVRHRAEVREHPQRLVKNGRTNRISRVSVATPDGPRVVGVKEFRERGTLDVVKRILGYRRGLQSWRGLHGLTVRGFRTPRGLGIVVPRGGGSEFLAFEWMGDWERLDHYVLRRFQGAGPEAREEKRRLVDAVADLFRRLVERRVYHGDLKATNILVRERDGLEFALLDTDRVVFDAPVSLRRRLKNLAQLYASVTHDIGIRERLRFFHRYASSERLLARRRYCYREIRRLCRRKTLVLASPIE